MSLEDALLERFFLEPGMRGPIRSVHITDDDLMEIFGASDIESARVSFKSSLPITVLLSAYLSGEFSPPMRDGRPDFVRILLFLCWMQVTRLRPRGLRDFREILEGHINHHLQHMQGLNGMWDALAQYLKSVHEIELVLPKNLPHPQIGRTLRVAFPTWRDRGVLRRLRANLDQDMQLVPVRVSSRIQTSAAFSGAPQSFKYNFEIWEEARLRGDEEALDLPFWQAWMFIVSETGGHDEIEATEDEYGDVSLATVAPDGNPRPILQVGASTRLRPGLVADIRRGLVFMEALGFGRFRSTSSLESRTLLVADSQMEGVDGSVASDIRALRGGWNLVTFRRSVDTGKPRRPTGASISGWKGGVRVGSAYLGRVPLTPSFEFSGKAQVDVQLDGVPLDIRVLDGIVELETGVLCGTLTARINDKTKSTRLLPSAIEHAEQRRKEINEAIETSEDGVLFGTSPTMSSGRETPWNGTRLDATQEFDAIAEALYARSIRGMAMSEAIDIVGRGIRRRMDAPTPWDILKSFSDGGWFDMAVLRNFPARKVLQRPLRFLPSASLPNGGAILGPMVSASYERIAKCANAAGVILQSMGALTDWAPRYHTVRADSFEALADFLRRSELSIAGPTGKARNRDQWGDQVSLHHYSVEAKWQAQSGHFQAHQQGPSSAGLYRMTSTRETDPKLYAIHDDERFVSTFRSPSLAVMSYSHLAGITGAIVDRDRLLRTSARVQLPASWARWVAARTWCNGGPVLQGGKWGYAYACDPTIVTALQDVLSLEVGKSRDASWDTFLASRSRKGRHVALADGQLGLTRGLPGTGVGSQ